MIRPTRAEIHLDKIKENLKILKNLHHTPRGEERDFFCPMIKANAYGHGDIEIAKFLSAQNVRQFGVVLVEEGIRLREKNIRGDIYVFGYFDEKSIQECIRHQLTPVISSFEFLEAIPKNVQTKIHLKFDTGMSRLGFHVSELSQLSEKLEHKKNIQVEGICTHFLQSEDAFLDEGVTHHQMQLFAKAEKELQKFYKYSHCMNSDALLNNFQGTERHHQNKNYLGARPGIAIYGYPSVSGQGKKTNLQPAMTLKTIIAQLKKIKKGESVSYGGTWKALRDSLIATVAIGYGDGYPRNLSNNSWMLYRGQRVPLVGRVCMDYCMLDLTEFEKFHPHIGEEIIVWGDGAISAEDLAKQMNTISYELITKVSARVERVYV
jgi:alanine racemase